jgi:hypothetical protein
MPRIFARIAGLAVMVVVVVAGTADGLRGVDAPQSKFDPPRANELPSLVHVAARSRSTQAETCQ